MIGFAVRRLSFSLLTLALVSVLMFAATEVLPGDVATALLGHSATPSAVHALRHQLGLEQPPLARYGAWLWGLLHGNLGTSLATRQPVASSLALYLRNTLLLAGVTIVVGITASLVLGVIAGLTRDRWPDLVISTLALVGMSVPEFVIATVLVLVFAVQLHLLPAVTTAAPDAPIGDLLPSVVLPAAALTVVMAAYIVRMVRTSLIDAMASEYVLMARLKGLAERRVVLRHALPSALLPTVNVVALTVGWLVGGVVIVESVFNYPGIGAFTVEAVHNRDLPVIQALGLLGAASYIFVNLLADVLMLILNPRLRASRG